LRLALRSTTRSGRRFVLLLRSPIPRRMRMTRAGRRGSASTSRSPIVAMLRGGLYEDGLDRAIGRPAHSIRRVCMMAGHFPMLPDHTLRQLGVQSSRCAISPAHKRYGSVTRSQGRRGTVGAHRPRAARWSALRPSRTSFPSAAGESFLGRHYGKRSSQNSRTARRLKARWAEDGRPSRSRPPAIPDPASQAADPAPQEEASPSPTQDGPPAVGRPCREEIGLEAREPSIRYGWFSAIVFIVLLVVVLRVAQIA
jgi:hypothetical protein